MLNIKDNKRDNERDKVIQIILPKLITHSRQGPCDAMPRSPPSPRNVMPLAKENPPAPHSPRNSRVRTGPTMLLLFQELFQLLQKLLK